MFYKNYYILLFHWNKYLLILWLFIGLAEGRQTEYRRSTSDVRQAALQMFRSTSSQVVPVIRLELQFCPIPPATLWAGWSAAATGQSSRITTSPASSAVSSGRSTCRPRNGRSSPTGSGWRRSRSRPGTRIDAWNGRNRFDYPATPHGRFDSWEWTKSTCLKCWQHSSIMVGCEAHGWLRGTVGRTSVFDRQTSPVLRSTCSWWMTTLWANRPL